MAKKDKNTIDLPEVSDIPGQEHVRPPRLGELADNTASSDDEEGDDVLNQKEDDDDDFVMTVPKVVVLISHPKGSSARAVWWRDHG